MSEKASKGRFLKPDKLQNHINEGKGKEKKKERGEGKEKKKRATVALLVFSGAPRARFAGAWAEPHS